MPFAPRTKFTKPALAVESFQHGGYERKVSDLLLQDPGVGLSPYLFEFRFGRTGSCTLYVGSSEKPAGTAGGYGYDKQGVALARWFCSTFAAELKAIFDQPKFRRQLNGSSSGSRKDGSRHPWYCVYRDEKTGAISINGMSGKDNVVEIMERSVGLTLRYIGETKTSNLYLLARMPVKGTK